MTTNSASLTAKELSKLTKEEWREYTKTVWSVANVSHSGHPAPFPIEIPRRLIKLFSFFGEMILDPFGGVGTSALAAMELGRDATLIDQNQEYVDIARQSISQMPDPQGTAEVLLGDSRKMEKIADNSIGLVVTSPPYWNKANYGEGAANLGNNSSYTDFIESLRPVFLECFRVLKPGRKLCVVTANVSQHTDHGLLSFPLATDFLVLLRSIGFNVVNEIIWNKDGTGGRWGSANNQRPIFGSYPYPPNFLFKTVHEYILIVAKPPAVKTKGPKVRLLDEIMNGTSMAHASNGRHGPQDENGTTSETRV